MGVTPHRPPLPGLRYGPCTALPIDPPGLVSRLTSRDFLASSNRVASIDLRLRLNENWFFTGQATASRTTNLEGSEQSGPAYDASVSYDSRSTHYSLSYTDRSQGFRTDPGFIPRNDIRQVTQSMERFAGIEFRRRATAVDVRTE